MSCLLYQAQALAIGPHDQTVDPTFTLLQQSVIRVEALDAGGAREFRGTGTVVGHHKVTITNEFGIQEDRSWLCILTADHVISSTEVYGGQINGVRIAPGNIEPSYEDFGIDPNPDNSIPIPSNPDTMLPRSRHIRRYGASGLSDLAVFALDVGPYNANNDNIVQPIVPVAAPPQQFSVIGYGNEGRLFDETGDGDDDGYQAQNKWGVERYVTQPDPAFLLGHMSQGYTYDAAIWPILDPDTWPTGGTTFDGDSGAPYFTSELVALDENHPIDPVDFPGFPPNKYYYFDGLWGVHTSFLPETNIENPPEGYKAYGTVNVGVWLSAADAMWIQNACMQVVGIPEPATFVLLSFGVLGLMLRETAKVRRGCRKGSGRGF